MAELSAASREAGELKTAMNRKDKELLAAAEQKAALDGELFAEKRRADELKGQARALEQQVFRLQAEAGARDERLRRLQEEQEARARPPKQPQQAETDGSVSAKRPGGSEERQLRDELSGEKARTERLHRDVGAANMEIVKVSEENARLKDKIFALVSNMKEFDQVVKKIERELARCEDTRNILCYHLEKLIGSVAGGPNNPDLHEIQRKADALLSSHKLAENKARVLEEHLARERAKLAALEEVHAQLKDQAAAQARLGEGSPPRGHLPAPQARFLGSGLKAWQDRPGLFERSLSPQRAKPQAEARNEFSPLGSAGLRSFSGSKQNTPERGLFEHRRLVMLNYHRDIADLKLQVRAILDSAEPVSVEARSVADYYTAALRALESRLLDIVRRAEQNSAGVAEAVRQSQLPETPRLAELGPAQTRTARSSSPYVAATGDTRYAGGTPSPLRSRSKSPFGASEALFKGDIREMYQQEGTFSSIREEFASSLRRSEAGLRPEPGAPEIRKIEEFVGNLRYILESIGRLRGKCGQIKQSYGMIDAKVREMVGFLQKKNPQNEAIGHLADFLDSSMARSMERSLENLDKLDSLCYKRVMAEFDGVYSKMREKLEDFKKSIDVRRLCLNSIMSKKNIFHN